MSDLPSSPVLSSSVQSASQPLAVLVLAGGKGTRMKSALPKVLHPLAHRPMLHHILHAIHGLRPSQIVVVTGYGADQVEAATRPNFPEVIYAHQAEQKGTGHAAQVGLAALEGFEGTVVIVYGDVLLAARPDALKLVLQASQAAPSALVALASQLPDATGLGRFVQTGSRWEIVEQKDCTPEQSLCQLANPGIYAAPAQLWRALLPHLKTSNAQAEYYLTDTLAMAQTEGHGVQVVSLPATRAEMGVNSREEQAAMEHELQNQLRRHHMANGVTLLDPSTVYFAMDTQVASEVVIEPNVVFGPGVEVGAGVRIRAFSHLEGCVVASNASVGPFARLRPGAVLEEQVHIGNFVEVKNSRIGAGAKANHLTYVGDADVGPGANLGAGTITANYNHHTKTKARTAIGAGASTGAGTILVAPVALGQNATTGANTVVRSAVGDHELLADKPGQLRKWPYPPSAAPKTSQE